MQLIVGKASKKTDSSNLSFRNLLQSEICRSLDEMNIKWINLIIDSVRQEISDPFLQLFLRFAKLLSKETLEFRDSEVRKFVLQSLHLPISIVIDSIKTNTTQDFFETKIDETFEFGNFLINPNSF